MKEQNEKMKEQKKELPKRAQSNGADREEKKTKQNYRNWLRKQAHAMQVTCVQVYKSSATQNN